MLVPADHVPQGGFRDVVGLGQAPDLRLDLLVGHLEPFFFGDLLENEVVAEVVDGLPPGLRLEALQGLRGDPAVSGGLEEPPQDGQGLPLDHGFWKLQGDLAGDPVQNLGGGLIPAGSLPDLQELLADLLSKGRKALGGPQALGELVIELGEPLLLDLPDLEAPVLGRDQRGAPGEILAELYVTVDDAGGAFEALQQVWLAMTTAAEQRGVHAAAVAEGTYTPRTERT